MEKIRQNIQTKKLWQIGAVLLGALLMGFLWRIRGTHGWGSSWGLLNAGFLFTMFIILVKGERKKLSFAWLGIISFIFMLTTPGWGTLLKQITGVLFIADDVAELPTYAGSAVYCSIPSAIFIMLCLGFGLASLFGIFLGAAYSEKQWKIRDFIILFAVFIGVDLLCKATVSHWILNSIQPQAADVFEEGLKLSGIDGTAWQTYMQHFDDYAWSKKFIGGRNYFASIETISLAIKAYACILATRFIIKDKKAADTGMVVCSAFAVSITVCDLFFYFCNGGYHMLGERYTGSFIADWNCWEYFTGFFAGMAITAYMIKSKPRADLPDLAFEKVPQKLSTVLSFALGYIFLIGVSIVRPIIERFNEGNWQIPAIILSVLAALALIIATAKKWGLKTENTNMTKVSMLLLPIMVTYEFVVYLFLGVDTYPNIDGIHQLQNIMVVASTAALLLTFIFVNKKQNRMNSV